MALKSWLPRRLWFIQSIYRWMVRVTRRPPVGKVGLGDFGRLNPIGPVQWSGDCSPIHRYYIQQFLSGQAFEIRGRVLQVGELSESSAFRPESRDAPQIRRDPSQRSEITRLTTIEDAKNVPDRSYDCIVCVQVLQSARDTEEAVTELFRVLVPGGHLLITAPGISWSPAPVGSDRKTVLWRFTEASLRRVLEKVFDTGVSEVRSYGNVLVASACLHGMMAEDLGPEVLDYVDPDYQVLVTARAARVSELE